MNRTRRLLALALAFVLAFGALGVTALAAEEPDKGYTITEEVVVREDAVPLGGLPTARECCALHFVLTLAALGVAVYYTHDRKRRQAREFELRAEL